MQEQLHLRKQQQNTKKNSQQVQWSWIHVGFAPASRSAAVYLMMAGTLHGMSDNALPKQVLTEEQWFAQQDRHKHLKPSKLETSQWNHLPGEVRNLWRFCEETATPSGCSALSLACHLLSLPVSYFKNLDTSSTFFFVGSFEETSVIGLDGPHQSSWARWQQGWEQDCSCVYIPIHR